MLIEQRIGSINKTQLMLRWVVPPTFCTYAGTYRYRVGPWRLVPIRLLNPKRWWKCVFSKWNYRVYVGGVRSDRNSRCYCPVGASCQGSVVICGWGVGWWWSRYNGDVPCPCDVAFGDDDDDDDEDVT